MCYDEETDNHMKSDIAIFFIKTRYSMNLNETFNVDVNNKIYRVKLVEDMHGPKRIFIPNVDSMVSETEDSGSDEDDDAWDNSEDEEDGEIRKDKFESSLNSHYDNGNSQNLYSDDSAGNVRSTDDVWRGLATEGQTFMRVSLSLLYTG